MKVGEARFAFRSKAVCPAVDTGLFASEVLSTFPKPTSPFTKPAGVVMVLFVSVCVPVVVTRIDVSAIPWIFVVSASWLVSAVAALVAVAAAAP